MSIASQIHPKKASNTTATTTPKKVDKTVTFADRL